MKQPVIAEACGQAGNEEKGRPAEGAVQCGVDKQRRPYRQLHIGAHRDQGKRWRTDDGHATVVVILLALEERPTDFHRPIPVIQAEAAQIELRGKLFQGRVDGEPFQRQGQPGDRKRSIQQEREDLLSVLHTDPFKMNRA